MILPHFPKWKVRFRASSFKLAELFFKHPKYRQIMYKIKILVRLVVTSQLIRDEWPMFSIFSPQFPQKVYSFSARIYPHSVQTPPVNFTWNLPWRDPHGLNAEFRLRVPKEWVRNGSFINLTMNNANIPPQRSGSSNANYNTHIRVDLHVWTGPLTSNSHLIDEFQQAVIQYQATKCVKMLSGSISQISVYHKGREGQPFGNQADMCRLHQHNGTSMRWKA